MNKGGVIFGAAVLLASCTTSPMDTPGAGTPSAMTVAPAPSATPVMNHTWTPTVTPSHEASVAGQINEDTGQTIDPAMVPSWDHSSVVSAEEVASAALAAFARPDLDHTEWWATVGPFFTTQAQQAYFYVLPENIPVREVTGPATLVDDTSAYVAVVDVPTDIGPYRVTLQRLDAETPWLVTDFDPPAS